MLARGARPDKDSVKRPLHAPVLPFLLALLSACASTSTHPLVLDPVGPVQPVRTAQATQGSLVVFSDWEGFGMGDPEHRLHSNYRVYGSDHQLIRRVVNYFTPVLEDPVVVGLPPGQYSVEARARGYGRVQVPVVVESGRMTVVRLDGSPCAPAPTDVATNLVGLPDGTPVGWRAAR